MSGTFQLSFDGETTAPMNAAATAEDVRLALEALAGITTAAVSREYSVTPVGGDTGAADLDLTFGSQNAHCANGEVSYELVLKLRTLAFNLAERTYRRRY